MEAPKLQLHNAYAVLGLPKGAPVREVKQAYRRLALLHHPDRPGGSARAFERLERAYNDGERYRLHYVTARECYNIIKAAEAGESGDPGAFRDYRLPPPPMRSGNAVTEERSHVAS